MSYLLHFILYIIWAVCKIFLKTSVHIANYCTIVNYQVNQSQIKTFLEKWLMNVLERSRLFSLEMKWILARLVTSLRTLLIKSYMQRPVPLYICVVLVLTLLTSNCKCQGQSHGSACVSSNVDQTQRQVH